MVTDVSVGGSSLHDGEVELMVHRRVMVSTSVSASHDVRAKQPDS